MLKFGRTKFFLALVTILIVSLLLFQNKGRKVTANIPVGVQKKADTKKVLPLLVSENEKDFIYRGAGIKKITKCPDGKVQGDIHELFSEIQGYSGFQSETGHYEFRKFIRTMPESCSEEVKNCEDRIHGERKFSVSSQLVVEVSYCDKAIRKKIQKVKLETICLNGINFLTGKVKEEETLYVPEKCLALKKVDNDN